MLDAEFVDHHAISLDSEISEISPPKRQVRVSLALSQIVRFVVDGHEEGVNEVTRFTGPLDANIFTPYGMCSFGRMNVLA